MSSSCIQLWTLNDTIFACTSELWMTERLKNRDFLFSLYSVKWQCKRLCGRLCSFFINFIGILHLIPVPCPFWEVKLLSPLHWRLGIHLALQSIGGSLLMVIFFLTGDGRLRTLSKCRIATATSDITCTEKSLPLAIGFSWKTTDIWCFLVDACY